MEDGTWDVVVLGGGLAGYTTAITAAEAGAHVALVEKTSEPGGSAVLSGGSFAFAGTPLQREQGIDDSPQRLRADLLDVGRHLNDPVLVDVYVTEQLAAFGWLRELGVRFDKVTLSSNQSRARTHGTNAPRMFSTLRGAAAKLPNIDYFFGAAAQRLTKDGGRVSGVTVSSVTGKGGAMTLAARHGVVLATGGFSRSAQLIRAFAPSLIPAAPLGGEGNTGDGIRLAMALGADLVDMGHVKGTFGTSAATGPEPQILLIAMYRGAVVVNCAGERFVDESLSYKSIGDECLKQPAAQGFQVFDARVMAQGRSDISVNDFRGALERGYVQQGSSLEEVATAAGIDAKGLVATITAYNEDVRAGRADRAFGRTSLGHGVGEPSPLAEPPYYVYPCTTGIPSTYGGLRVDAAMRVIDVFGDPLEGLLAAGEVVGGFHGAGYISGSSLAKSVITGRVAGRTVTT